LVVTEEDSRVLWKAVFILKAVISDEGIQENMDYYLIPILQIDMILKYNLLLNDTSDKIQYEIVSFLVLLFYFELDKEDYKNFDSYGIYDSLVKLIFKKLEYRTGTAARIIQIVLQTIYNIL
jgi:hypothetical protein